MSFVGDVGVLGKFQRSLPKKHGYQKVMLWKKVAPFQIRPFWWYLFQNFMDVESLFATPCAPASHCGNSGIRRSQVCPSLQEDAS